jgi:hypothetical protein
MTQSTGTDSNKGGAKLVNVRTSKDRDDDKSFKDSSRNVPIGELDVSNVAGLPLNNSKFNESV